eukprot:TRINITY_DN888_c0_g1_i1.p2 TRINITY_DN888_c0_g1~~TRINITY_DN888_c0_g1_i1.p2  ORF type:complete len:325 (-),score=122.86 TRINITY_DN888_c0_g1_i1:31-1005(-)
MRTRRYYWAAVTHVDEQVGEVIKALKRTGTLDNTLLIYTADHGDMMGDHFHWRKCTPYEGSTRIPMVMKWPSTWTNVPLPRGSFLKEPVELRDLLPTFLDAARIPLPSQVKLDGQSFLLLLQKRFSEWRPWLDMEHDDCYGPLNRWNAGTDGYWKYVWNSATSTEYLWNLEEDPAERFDLSANPKYEGELKKWRARIVEQFEREGRGDYYVKDGKLMPREEGRTYSENYERPVTPKLYWKPKNKPEQDYGYIPMAILQEIQQAHAVKGKKAEWDLGEISDEQINYYIPNNYLDKWSKLIYFSMSLLALGILYQAKKMFSLIFSK